MVVILRLVTPAKGLYFRLRLTALLIVALSWPLAAQPHAGPSVNTEAALQAAYVRLYNFDFKGAHAILDRQRPLDPQQPLILAVGCAAYLFAELDRLKILELDFFTDDDKVVDRRKLIPDPVIRQKFFDMVAESDKLANSRLAIKPDDPDALLALCMTTGLVTDYAALVEKRRFGSFALAKKSHIWAKKLLMLNPPMVDAYMTFGTAEYIVGSLPFFLRWFVHMDSVEGSKTKGIEELNLVAEKGRYCGPFARMLLAVIALREKHPEEAERLLAGLNRDYPENPLIRLELARVNHTLHPGSGVVITK